MGEKDVQPVIDVLALLAYGEFAAFVELAAEAEMSPDLGDRLIVGELAAGAFAQHQRIAHRVAELGGDPVASMSRFKPAVDAFGLRVCASDWPESMAKLFVGSALAYDFYKTLGPTLDPETEELLAVRVDHQPAIQFASRALLAVLTEQPELRNRLSLYSRRLVGEILNVSHRLATDRPGLVQPLLGDDRSDPWARMSHVTSQLLEAHATRMADMGLTS